MDRTICKTHINNSVEKRKSTIENIYNSGNDHNCAANTQQINSLDYLTTPTTTALDGIIVIRAIKLLFEEAASSLNNTLAEQAFEQREEKRKHQESILQTSDVSLIQYRESPELSQGPSVENLNLSKVSKMEVDECPNRDEYQQKHRCGPKLVFERESSTNTPQTKSRDLAVKNVGLVNKNWPEILFDKEAFKNQAKMKSCKPSDKC